ncbi:uncharacterized protein PITG_00808 [Phytophthora infestans T30-4]|uniref:DDE-1 domain-containing protein n=1 Tax=Phytophthora infestans (strain T30-4) TaxID=403677 RepID=D0MRR3_PHYIT|nr:uncharacterized protein PITG_00808 [Phytophthora infestans T30-4]EEY58182.1 conserved hypothetical protein [Phytophthora infestans T30-4]|eukprot:XP_002909368.1 conserved hypothetical protein [Phytophthora infestans T30-4]
MKKPVKKQKKKVKRQTVSIHTWTAALAAVNDGMSLSLAAKTYGVSREPLRQRHLGLVPIVARPGPQLVYISEGGDRGLVEVIVYRALHAVKYGQEHDVHIIVLPAHTSNFLQPLDVSVFGSFKRRYQSALKRFPSTHNYMLPTKDKIAEISRDPLMLACRPENAKRGFEKADENYSGGDLLSYEEMKAAVQAKEDAKALKEANKKSTALEKREQAAMNLHDKKQYQTARTQLVLQREEKRHAKAQ